MVHIFFRKAGSPVRLSTAFAVLTLAISLGGCASVPPPNDSMNDTQSRLQAARNAGAADYAPVDLGFAQDKFQQAQAAFSDRKYDDASRLAEESRADAELATAKARLGAARAQIQSKTQDNANLRSEGQQVEAAAEQQEQLQQQQDQQRQQQLQQPPQVGEPAQAASSIPTPQPEDMPSPSSSVMSAPTPTQGSGGFQTLPDAPPPGSGQPPVDPNDPDANNQGGHR